MVVCTDNLSNLTTWSVFIIFNLIIYSKGNSLDYIWLWTSEVRLIAMFHRILDFCEWTVDLDSPWGLPLTFRSVIFFFRLVITFTNRQHLENPNVNATCRTNCRHNIKNEMWVKIYQSTACTFIPKGLWFQCC